jgi:hypothetical protein
MKLGDEPSITRLNENGEQIEYRGLTRLGSLSIKGHRAEEKLEKLHEEKHKYETIEYI